MPRFNGLLDFFFSALESKLVSQFCEDENGAVIYNRITNGHLNGNSGHRNGIKGNNGDAKNNFGFNGASNDGYGNNGYGKNGIGDNDQAEIQNQRRPSSRGHGDTFTLPISADPLPVQVFATNKEQYTVDIVVADGGVFYTILTIFMLTFCCRRWRMMTVKT